MRMFARTVTGYTLQVIVIEVATLLRIFVIKTVLLNVIFKR